MASRREPFALYLDTSALVKLFVAETGSAKVRALAGGRAGADILLASRLGYTEASVSLARMVHLGRLPAALLARHLGALERYWDESIAVSYTHLRAHETDSYLVCRLLLEK